MKERFKILIVSFLLSQTYGGLSHSAFAEDLNAFPYFVTVNIEPGESGSPDYRTIAGLVSVKGEVLQEPKYSEWFWNSPTSAFVWFEDREKCATINIRGKEVPCAPPPDDPVDPEPLLPTDSEWDNIDTPIGDAAPIGYRQCRKDGLYGILDGEGQLVIEARYELLRYIQTNRILARLSDCRVLLDGSGNPILENQLQEVLFFGGRDTLFAKLDGAWGIIDYDGHWVLPSEFDAIRAGKVFDGSLQYALVKKGDAWGIYDLVDNNGDVEYDFEDIQMLYNEVLVFTRGEGRWGAMDVNKKVVVPEVYRAIKKLTGMSNELLRVTGEEGTGAVRPGDWEVLVPPVYERVQTEDLGHCGKTFLLSERDGIQTLWTLEGEEVLPGSMQITRIESHFRNDYGRIVTANGVGLLHCSGKIVLPPSYEGIGIYVDGVVPVKEAGLWGYMTLDGEWAIQPKYDMAHAFSEGVASVMNDGKYGYVNPDGELVLSYRYHDAGYCVSGSLPVAEMTPDGKKWGLANLEGKVLLPFEYDSIYWKTHSLNDFGAYMRTPYGAFPLSKWMVGDQWYDIETEASESLAKSSDAEEPATH